MNSKLAKKLRRMAREEMSGDKVPDEELVIARMRGADRVVHNPGSVKAMEIQLKKAYKAARARGPAVKPESP